jgi:hypothetical protein
MERKVDFVACDMPSANAFMISANAFMINVYAAVAQEERRIFAIPLGAAGSSSPGAISRLFC